MTTNLTVRGVVSLLLCASWAFGAGAGEILMAPHSSKERPAKDAAAEVRNAAKVQRGADNATAVPMTTIIEQLDESPIGPHPDGAVTDNLNRARSYQQGGAGGTPNDPGRILVDPDSTQGKTKNNIDRARAYMKGDSPGVTGARFGGSDNLPVVDCNSQASSVAARIGDETIAASGSIIIVMRDGKGVKVRCK